MQKCRITTTVDVTYTGVRHKTDAEDWWMRRNQQRNYDTLIQVLSLRTQPLNISLFEHETVKHIGINSNGDVVKIWILMFDVEHRDVLGREGELFLEDIHGVPVMTGLKETHPPFPQQFISRGPMKNIDILILEDESK